MLANITFLALPVLAGLLHALKHQPARPPSPDIGMSAGSLDHDGSGRSLGLSAATDLYESDSSQFDDDDDWHRTASGYDSFDDDFWDTTSPLFDHSPSCGTNPASGLPMLNDCIDVGGNPFGCSSSFDSFDSFGSSFNSSGNSFDSFNGISSSFDSFPSSTSIGDSLFD